MTDIQIDVRDISGTETKNVSIDEVKNIEIVDTDMMIEAIKEKLGGVGTLVRLWNPKDSTQIKMRDPKSEWIVC